MKTTEEKRQRRSLAISAIKKDGSFLDTLPKSPLFKANEVPDLRDLLFSWHATKSRKEDLRELELETKNRSRNKKKEPEKKEKEEGKSEEERRITKAVQQTLTRRDAAFYI